MKAYDIGRQSFKGEYWGLAEINSKSSFIAA